MRNLSTNPHSPENRDFRFVGIIWYVKVKQGWRSEFYRLSDLRRYLAEGRIQKSDRLSYDRENWIPLNQIADLEGYFEDVWHRANRGTLKVRHEIGRDRGFDEASPTRVVDVGHIRQALDEANRSKGTDPLRLTPPDVDAMEMPDEDNTGMFTGMSLDELHDMDDGNTGMFTSMDVEDEPTMEPPEPLRPPPARILSAPAEAPAPAPAPAEAAPTMPVDPPPAAMVKVFVSGILAGLAVFGVLLWLSGS